MYKIGIVGDGYTAADLLRILAQHERAEARRIFSVENIGRRIDEVYPHLIGFSELVCEESNWELLKEECDLVFLALPHGLSVSIAMELMPAGVKCVDLGADFRLKDAGLYEEYYELTHPAPELLKEAVYGLPELYRQEIKQAALIANPGCFPTGAILPLVPLLEAGLLESTNLIVDSKTGVSGAGKTPKASSHFCEINEGVKAYGVGTHRHGPEIAQELSQASGKKVEVLFVPHLIPMNRGILTTIYARLRPTVDAALLRTVLEDRYRDEEFVRVLPEGVMPHTKWVYGSNILDIGIYVDEKNRQVVLVSALDNLVKGASGQAIQNMNLLLGIEENSGLKSPGIYP